MIEELNPKENGFKILAYKHDGLNYRNWFPVYQLKPWNNHSMFYSPKWKTQVYEWDNKSWKPAYSFIWVFSHTKFFNVVCMLKESQMYYYINLATPPVILNKQLVFIDYDLDYKCDIDGKMELRDLEEYHHNIKKYNYNSRLVRKINNSTKQIKGEYEAGVFPFKNSSIFSYLIKKEEEYNGK